MGFDAGAATLPASAAEIDREMARLRAELVRAAMIWLVGLAVERLGEGNTWLALRGSADRISTLVRQVAIYLGHTALGLLEGECAEAFRLSKMAAARAMQTIEKRRDEPGFNLKIEQLEAMVAARGGRAS